EEPQRPADGDEELARVDRADDLARLQTAGRQQRRGADRAPAAPADGVERSADEAHRHEEPGTRTGPEGRALAAEGEEAPDDIDANSEQDDRDPWRGRRTVEIRQNGRADQRDDESRARQQHDQATNHDSARAAET